jgi:hypothetical protein
MLGSNTNFEKLLAEISELLLVKIPVSENKIIVLRKQDFYDSAEEKKNNDELDTLKKVYSQTAEELVALDSVRANLEIEKIIKQRKTQDASFFVRIVGQEKHGLRKEKTSLKKPRPRRSAKNIRKTKKLKKLKNLEKGIFPLSKNRKGEDPYRQAFMKVKNAPYLIQKQNQIEEKEKSKKWQIMQKRKIEIRDPFE